MLGDATTWDSVPLDDLTEEDTPITYGVVKPGDNGEVPFVRGGDIADGRVLMSQLRTISREISQQYRRTLLRGGEILVSLVGNPGQIAIAPPSLSGANIARQVGLVRLKPEIDTRYVSYFLQSHDGQTALGAQSLGSVQQVINLRDLKKVKVPLPPLQKQKAIASILGTLDEKIELNRRMNETLEALARSLFKSWFVDFDPVRAKLDGIQSVGIGEATANLFPNAFQDSSLGHIPKGWEIRDLDKTADYLNGLALQKYPPGEGLTFPVIKIAQLRKGDVIGADRCGTELPKQFIVEDGDVLFSWSGSLEVELWCGGTGALNQHLFKVTSKEFPKWFYYLWTLHHLDEFRLIAASKATTMGHIQRSHITDAKVVAPPRNLLDAMTLTMSPIIDQLIANRIQSRTLAVLRDTLLPKLLSGELSVENLQT
jgi:type I restriction enzyme S subunit